MKLVLVVPGWWSHAGGRFFWYERIRRTMFCWVSLRYPTKKELKARVERIRAVAAMQSQQHLITDTYMRGLYNGLELALATMENRDPVYHEVPK